MKINNFLIEIHNFIYSYKYLFIIVFILILIFLILLLFSLCCFFLYKYFHIKYYKIYLDNYHGNSGELLSKYGDYPIKNVYILKEKLSNIKMIAILEKILNLLFFKKKYELGNLNHTSLICDVDLGNNIIKKIKINKNLYVNLMEDFNINGKIQEIKCNKLKNKKYTLNYVLNKTKNNINSRKYYNWSIHNNCQNFTKKVLLTMKLFNKKNIEFMEYKNVKLNSKTFKNKEKIFIYIFHFFINIICFFYKLFF